MTPPAKTFMGSKINYFHGSISLCPKGSNSPGFSRREPNQFFSANLKGRDREDFDKAAGTAFILALAYPHTALTSPT